MVALFGKVLHRQTDGRFVPFVIPLCLAGGWWWDNIQTGRQVVTDPRRLQAPAFSCCPHLLVPSQTSLPCLLLPPSPPYMVAPCMRALPKILPSSLSFAAACLLFLLPTHACCVFCTVPAACVPTAFLPYYATHFSRRFFPIYRLLLLRCPAALPARAPSYCLMRAADERAAAFENRRTGRGKGGRARRAVLQEEIRRFGAATLRRGRQCILRRAAHVARTRCWAEKFLHLLPHCALLPAYHHPPSLSLPTILSFMGQMVTSKTVLYSDMLFGLFLMRFMRLFYQVQ